MTGEVEIELQDSTHHLIEELVEKSSEYDTVEEWIIAAVDEHLNRGGNR